MEGTRDEMKIFKAPTLNPLWLKYFPQNNTRECDNEVSFDDQ